MHAFLCEMHTYSMLYLDISHVDARAAQENTLDKVECTFECIFLFL